MATYGRADDSGDNLTAAGIAFLKERAALGRHTSYSEMSSALARRTGLPEFDFSQQIERAGMGYLLGRIVNETYASIGAMLSALVIYLDANDAGPGFYKLAEEMGLLPGHASKPAKDAFWVDQFSKVTQHYRGNRI